MNSAVAAALIGLGGVIIGGAIASVTAWWQASIARKDRLDEMRIQLAHERFLRDEGVRRTAMLELGYSLRRFDSACTEAERSHDHNQKFSSQTEDTAIAELIKAGQSAIDVLDKNLALVNKSAQDDLEGVRDAWSDVSVYGKPPFAPSWANLSADICCPLGRDLEVLDIIIFHAVSSLDDLLSSMRFD